ncbi:MAG: hypothetical protein ACRCXT_20330 [Paraclostridium sp.]
MSKNKKILIIVIIGVIVMSSIYVISTYSAMKQYEGYAIDDYKLTLKDLYKRNSVIIENKEVITKNIPNIDINVENIEKLVDKETKDMNINDGIELSNKIEQNVTTIINEYKNNENLTNNEEIKGIMKTLMEVDHNCSVSQNLFNQSINDNDTGYNGLYSSNIINTKLAQIFGLSKIGEFKSE